MTSLGLGVAGFGLLLLMAGYTDRGLLDLLSRSGGPLSNNGLGPGAGAPVGTGTRTNSGTGLGVGQGVGAPVGTGTRLGKGGLLGATPKD